MRPTYEQVRAKFIYDPDDGRIIRKSDRKVYTYTDSQGYIELKVCGFQTRAHRIAYLLQTGEWPPEGFVMDHINGDRQDNTWANLRLLPQSVNAAQQTNSGYGCVRTVAKLRRQAAVGIPTTVKVLKAAASVSSITLNIEITLELPQVAAGKYRKA